MIERYALPEIKRIWDDENKYEIWTKIEILACEARARSGDMPEDDLSIIKSKAKTSIARINEIEKVTNHDVIAFLTNLSEEIGPAARHIHFGMTSSDILDTTLSIQMKQSAELIIAKLILLRNKLKEQALRHKHSYCIGRTHGVHAEPITMGLKFVLWFEETKRNITRLKNAMQSISVGKISGAVGTFDHLSPSVETYVCEKLGLKPAPISTQILQRDRHAEFLAAVAIAGGTLEKIATEIRHLQKTEVLEAEEPFGKGQKGSSAMPHKKNPILCERVAGLARVLRGNALAAMENITLWHERDITHSSVERIIIPDSCMILYYMIYLMDKICEGMVVHPENMLKNMGATRGLISSQKVLLKLVEKGFTREEAYAIVQRSALEVWNSGDKHLLSVLSADPEVATRITTEELQELFNSETTIQNLDAIYARTIGE